MINIIDKRIIPDKDCNKKIDYIIYYAHIKGQGTIFIKNGYIIEDREYNHNVFINLYKEHEVNTHQTQIPKHYMEIYKDKILVQTEDEISEAIKLLCEYKLENNIKLIESRTKQNEELKELINTL